MRHALLILLLAACSAEPTPYRRGSTPQAERVVIDTRDPQSFAAGHTAGAINIQLDYGQLSRRIEAYVPEKSTPLAVRSETPAEEVALGILRRRGYGDVVLHEPRGESATLRTTTAAALREALRSDDPPIVIDVRTEGEQEEGTIAGAILLDQDDVIRHVAELDRSRRYSIICAGGFRSSQLASWMVRNGFEDVENVIDGMWAWYEIEDE